MHVEWLVLLYIRMNCGVRGPLFLAIGAQGRGVGHRRAARDRLKWIHEHGHVSAGMGPLLTLLNFFVAHLKMPESRIRIGVKRIIWIERIMLGHDIVVGTGSFRQSQRDIVQVVVMLMTLLAQGICSNWLAHLQEKLLFEQVQFSVLSTGLNAHGRGARVLVWGDDSVDRRPCLAPVNLVRLAFRFSLGGVS